MEALVVFFLTRPQCKLLIGGLVKERFKVAEIDSFWPTPVTRKWPAKNVGAECQNMDHLLFY